jgi:uncharacterized protein YjiS (DUF1127 family)
MARSIPEIVHSEVETSERASRSGATSWLRHCGAVLAAWMARVRERRELQELDDRLLADIGLTHADVERECAKPFWVASGRKEQI